MKVTLKRLSACPCGFHALNDDIKLGTEYEVQENRPKLTFDFICGNCGHKQKLMGISVTRDGGPPGYLPELLFSDEGQKMMKLTDILSETQLDEVERILNESEGDRMKATLVLRRYLSMFKTELEAKGVVSDYLAYVIAYKQWTGGDNGDRVVAFSA
jgi:hypothetical protein